MLSDVRPVLVLPRNPDMARKWSGTAIQAVFIAQLAIVAIPSFAAADAPPQCDQMAAEVAQRIGSTLEKRSDAGDYGLGKKNDVELRLRCPVGNQRSPRIVLSWKAVYPPRSYWNTVADVGARLTGASHRRVRFSAHKCHKASLHAADGHSNTRARGLGFECQTRTTDGGSTSVSIRRRADVRL